MKKNILVVAAHADDEVLGCGATIARHVAQGDEIKVLILSDGESSRQRCDVDYRLRCLHNACEILGVKDFDCTNLRDGFLDDYPLVEIVRLIEKSVANFFPHIVYTHSEFDLNPDHQVTHRAVINAFRPLPERSPEQILCFEIPSSTEWNSFSSRQAFTPNVFIEISEEQFRIKMNALRAYKNELRSFPHPRSEEYITSLMRVRGGMTGVKLAEAFFAERIIQRLEERHQ